MQTGPLRGRADRFLTIRNVPSAAGVDAQVVLFYARIGLIRPARYAANGYRQFVSLDAKRVRFVRAAQSLGFRLASLGAFHSRMRRASQRWRHMPDRIPTGDVICALIEAVVDDGRPG